MEMKWFAIMMVGIAFALMSPLIFSKGEDPRSKSYRQCLWADSDNTAHAIECAKAIYGTEQVPEQK